MDWGWGLQPYGDDWGSTLQSLLRHHHSRTRSLNLDVFLKKYKTNITFYFGYNTKDENFDTYENNYVKTLINPLTVKAFVRELSITSLIFRHYGLEYKGAVELLIDETYLNWFKICTKIKINDNYYEVFRSSVGQYSSIRQAPFGLLLVVLERKSGTELSVPSDSKYSSTNLENTIRLYGKTVQVYPGYTRTHDEYDADEKNLKINYLNPLSIKACINKTSSSIKVLTHYGLKEHDAVELVTTQNHTTLLINSRKLKIDNAYYHVFKDKVGQSAYVIQGSDGLLSVVLERTGGTILPVVNDNKYISADLRNAIRSYGKTIQVYPGYTRKHDEYDEDENNLKVNYLNPLPIKAYINRYTGLIKTMVQYGLREQDSLEITTTQDHANLILNSRKIKVDSLYYHVFKDSDGNNSAVEQSNGMIKVIVESI